MTHTRAPISVTAAALLRSKSVVTRTVLLLLFVGLIGTTGYSGYRTLLLFEHHDRASVTRQETPGSILGRLSTALGELVAITSAVPAQRPETPGPRQGESRAVGAFRSAYADWQRVRASVPVLEIQLIRRLDTLLGRLAEALAGPDRAGASGDRLVGQRELLERSASVLQPLLIEAQNALLLQARGAAASDMAKVHDAARRFVLFGGLALCASLLLAWAYLRQLHIYDHQFGSMGNLAEIASSSSGVALFEGMVRFLGERLGVDYVFIGKLDEHEPKSIKTLALYAHQGLAGNVTLTLVDTPCEQVLQNGRAVYPRAVQQHYPKDRFLNEMGVDAYAGFPLFDAQGEPVGILVIMHGKRLDEAILSSSVIRLVTTRAQNEIERQRAEVARAQVLQELEARVDARTADLRRINEKLSDEVAVRGEIERQLVQARQHAEEANRIKGEFLANASHEIRTHINGLLGMLSLLEDSQLHGEQIEFVDMAHLSGDVLLALINDLLDYSKIEAGQLDLEAMDFDLRRLVGDVVDLFSVRARAAGLALGLNVDPEVARYYQGDAVRIRQVLSNMVDNALKFTSEGQVTIRVTLADDREERATVRFEVEDTGIGIDSGRRAQLFKPFSQADGTISRRFGGTGLGLAICAQLVRLLGGRIDADGTPGVGARFWFEVPLAASAGIGDRVAAGKRESLEGLRALVVDDSAVSRAYVRGLLVAWKIGCDVAVDGEQALELLRDAAASGHRYDLVILDRLMPKIDGITLASTVSGDPVLAGTKLIMVTHYSGSTGNDDLLRSGIDGCLNKPISQSQLYNLLTTVVGLAGAPEQPDAPASPRPGGVVLVVEDNIVNQRVAVGMLKKLGFVTRVAENGHQALAGIRAGGVDLVLMDCQMPVMDGYQAVRELRRLEHGDGDHLPVIAMTAHALGGEREKCLAAGMDDYLAKPVRIAELRQKLDYWMVRDRRPAVVTASASTAPADTPGNDRSHLDPAVIEGLRDIMGDGIGELIDTYIEDSDRRLQVLRSLVDHDPDQLARVAHTFKGSSANLGAARLADVCAELYRYAADGGEQVTALIARVEAEYGKVRSELAHLRST